MKPSRTSFMKEYSRLRAKKWARKAACDAAKTTVRFAELEEQGLVKLECEPDEILYDDSYIDTWDDQTAQLAEAKAELWERIKREGVWNMASFWRASKDDAWEFGDSVCSFIGDDWKDSVYDTDVRRAAMTALEAELQRRNPTSYMTPLEAERAGLED